MIYANTQSKLVFLFFFAYDSIWLSLIISHFTIDPNCFYYFVILAIYPPNFFSYFLTQNK